MHVGYFILFSGRFLKTARKRSENGQKMARKRTELKKLKTLLSVTLYIQNENFSKAALESAYKEALDSTNNKF